MSNLQSSTATGTGGQITVTKFQKENDGKIVIGLKMPSELKKQLITNMTGNHSDQKQRTAPLVNIAAIVDQVISPDGTLNTTKVVPYTGNVQGFKLSVPNEYYVDTIKNFELARRITTGGNSQQQTTTGGSRRSVRRYKSIRRRRSTKRRN